MVRFAVVRNLARLAVVKLCRCANRIAVWVGRVRAITRKAIVIIDAGLFVFVQVGRADAVIALAGTFTIIFWQRAEQIAFFSLDAHLRLAPFVCVTF